MKTACLWTAAATLLLCSSATAGEIKGAAILDHPCGKTTVKHMGLANAGKMAEAVKLGTDEMQEKWNGMSAEERTMLGEMMKDLSIPEKEFAEKIKANGLLVVEGSDATLTVKEDYKSGNGSGTATITQKFKIAAGACLVSN